MLQRAPIWGGGGAIVVGALVAGIVIGSSGESDAATETNPEMLHQPDAECKIDSTEPCSLDLSDGLELSATEDTTITDNGDGTVTVSGVFQVDPDSSLENHGSQGVGVSAFAKLLDPAYSTAS